MRECALCHTEIASTDEPVLVTTAITATGISQDAAHDWCARAQREAAQRVAS